MDLRCSPAHVSPGQCRSHSRTACAGTTRCTCSLIVSPRQHRPSTPACAPGHLPGTPPPDSSLSPRQSCRKAARAATRRAAHRRYRPTSSRSRWRASSLPLAPPPRLKICRRAANSGCPLPHPSARAVRAQHPALLKGPRRRTPRVIAVAAARLPRRGGNRRSLLDHAASAAATGSSIRWLHGPHEAAFRGAPRRCRDATAIAPCAITGVAVAQCDRCVSRRAL